MRTRHHADAPAVRELDRIGADIARATMHEDRLAATELRMVEQHLFGGSGDNRNGSRLDRR
jgi:hypothetical protein